MRNSLAASNPYLRDRTVRERLAFRSVASSSAVDGIRKPFRNRAAVVGKKSKNAGIR